ncbi:diguanylate cyclase [Burkholderiaceae bacterium UC74_6]
MDVTVPKWSSFSLRVQLTLLIGGLSLAALAGTGWYAGSIAIERQKEIGGDLLQATTDSGAVLLAQGLEERRKEVQLLARSHLMRNGDLAGDEVRAELESRQRYSPEYAWLGVARLDATVVQSTGGVLQGVSVAQRPWFKVSSQGEFYTGDVHEAVLLARALKRADPNQPLRFIDFAAPIFSPQDEQRGVVAAHAHWNWVTDTIVKATVDRLKAPGVQVLIAQRDGTVLYPESLIGQTKLPSGVPQDGRARLLPWSDKQDYLSAFSTVPGKHGLDWVIALRQPADLALRDAAQLRNRLLVSALLASVLVAALCYSLAVRLSRPLERLAHAAEDVRERHAAPSLPREDSSPELLRLSESFADMTRALLATETRLLATNQGLENMVAARTAELSRANEELARQASLDGLTGVYNRRSFDARLHEVFLAHGRSRRPYWVVLIDVDHFKSVNDTHGHQVGDDVLREVARCISAAVRETDFVARYGGEEFVVVLNDTKDRAAATRAAEKIREAIASKQIAVVGHITASLGASRVQGNDANDRDAVKRADLALYAAKSGGRNRSIIAPEESATVGEGGDTADTV